MNKKQIKDTINKHEIKANSLKNSIIAFVSGGLFAIIAQFMQESYIYFFQISKEDATSYVIVTIILITSILSAAHKYDKIAQICGAGVFIPISGFANALTSCAIDSKKEGFILGVGSNMFKLAGSVITYGVVSATILAVVRYLL